ncbi:hypothetical protein CUZ56_01873 [Saezia sanguinis]|uniref:Glycosyltransferase RgtA/B/C/D-like domain-containing protein n=1 Tax=Saezia sanguinis TaxID=1965230 RepID=A0A433SCW9_9BURK|nr:hypothetical protein [Saezia sanguinis]RUS66593.1 hypothetical protein CUZ56_01873 [Saezia sanguinis]
MAWLKNNISIPIALLVALVHWGLSFYFEVDFYSQPTIENPFLIASKLLFLVMFWQIIAYMIRRYLKEPEYRQFIAFASIYFAICMLLLLLIWPGFWGADAFELLVQVRRMEFNAWQHFLTHAFYYCAVFIFPTPVSINILQLVIISLIVGYFVYCIYTVCGHSKIAAACAYIPFLLPNILLQDSFILRATVFAYLVLFLFTRYLFKAWERKNIPLSAALFFAFITALACTLRTEGFLIALASILMFLVGFRHLSTRGVKMVFIVATVLLTSVSQYTQKSLLALHDEKIPYFYAMTTVIDPLHPLVLKAREEGRQDLLASIAAVLDIDQFAHGQKPMVLIIQPNIIKPAYYESPRARRHFLRAYFNLIKTYPTTFIQERLDTFLEPNNNSHNTIYRDGYSLWKTYHHLFENSVSDFLNKSLRENTISCLILAETPISFFFNNHLIPIVLLSLLILISLIKRNYIAFFGFSVIIGTVMLVFLTAPGTMFMYYFLSYLNGYAFTVGAVIIYMNCFKQKCIQSR